MDILRSPDVVHGCPGMNDLAAPGAFAIAHVGKPKPAVLRLAELMLR